MWLLYPYLTRRWRQVAVSVFLIALATYVVITATVLLEMNWRTISYLERRANHLVKVTGIISEAELLSSLPEESLEIIPAAIAYLRYPLLFGRSTVLPVYGVTELDAQKLLTVTNASITADSVIPEFNALYVPESFLKARAAVLGAELTEHYLEHGHTFSILGTVDSSFDFALASRDTITNLSVQEPALLVYASTMDAESLESMLSERLAGKKNVRVVGPSYFASLNQERIREATVASIICLLAAGLILTGVLLVLTGKQQPLFAVEQAVARLYRSGVQASLMRPLAVGVISGMGGWAVGTLAALGTYAVINRFFVVPRGMVAALPGAQILAVGIYSLIPILCQLLVWVSTLRIDAISFLAQTPAAMEPNPEAVAASNRPSQGISL